MNGGMGPKIYFSLIVPSHIIPHCLVFKIGEWLHANCKSACKNRADPENEASEVTCSATMPAAARRMPPGQNKNA